MGPDMAWNEGLQAAARPHRAQASGLDPVFRPTPRLELQESNFFWPFFPPFLPNFGTGHAPSDVTTFLGEGHVAPEALKCRPTPESAPFCPWGRAFLGSPRLGN